VENGSLSTTLLREQSTASFLSSMTRLSVDLPARRGGPPQPRETPAQQRMPASYRQAVMRRTPASFTGPAERDRVGHRSAAPCPRRLAGQARQAATVVASRCLAGPYLCAACSSAGGQLALHAAFHQVGPGLGSAVLYAVTRHRLEVDPG
jgi:hypothetical protein